MRARNTMKNLIASLVCEIVIIAFGFVVPRLIIDAYGSEVNGLTSTIHQILQILNLLQAGAVGASIFQMFKPVAEKDYYQISRVMAASRRYFFKIGFIFLASIFVVAPIFGFTLDGNLGVFEIIIAFIILGVNGAGYFFFTSWFDILFSSHQKRFQLSIATIIGKLVYYGLLFLVVLMRWHFTLMYVVALVGSGVKLMYLYVIYLKEFKHKLVKVENDGSFTIKNKGYLMSNQISTQAVEAMPTILITALKGLAIASVFAVYNLIQNMIKMVVKTMQCSVSEVFGNLVVSENDNRVKKVYNLMEFVFFLVAVVLCGCACFLFMPFIFLYTNGNSLDINYVFPVLAFLIVAFAVIYCMYQPCYTLTNVLGLYKETYLQSIICGVISIGVAIGLGLIYWPLIMIGPVFYYLSSLVYRMIIASRRVKWLVLKKFIIRVFTVLLLIVGVYFLSQYIFSSGYPLSWGKWLLFAIITALAVISFAGIYVLIFERKEAKDLFAYIKNIFKRKRKSIRG